MNHIRKGWILTHLQVIFHGDLIIVQHIMYDETGLGQAYAVDEPWYIVHSYNNSKPILK